MNFYFHSPELFLLRNSRAKLPFEISPSRVLSSFFVFFKKTGEKNSILQKNALIHFRGSFFPLFLQSFNFSLILLLSQKCSIMMDCVKIEFQLCEIDFCLTIFFLFNLYTHAAQQRASPSLSSSLRCVKCKDEKRHWAHWNVSNKQIG